MFMKTTVSSFATLVARDYGLPVAGQFSKYFGDNRELSFGQAMEVLDNILAGSDAPAMPRFGATDSVPSKVTLVFED